MNRRQAIQSLVGGSVLFPALVTRMLAEDEAVDPLARARPTSRRKHGK
jgi:hypothetical protein